MPVEQRETLPSFAEHRMAGSPSSPSTVRFRVERSAWD